MLRLGFLNLRYLAVAVLLHAWPVRVVLTQTVADSAGFPVSLHPPNPTAVRLRVQVDRPGLNDLEIDQAAIKTAIASTLAAHGVHAYTGAEDAQHANAPMLGFRVLVSRIASRGQLVGYSYRADCYVAELVYLDRVPKHPIVARTYEQGGKLGTLGREGDMTAALITAGEAMASQYATGAGRRP